MNNTGCFFYGQNN